MPLVSVVIPCHNYGRFLSDAINSVLAQTHPDIELIVVDYESTDETEQIAAEYPEVRYLRRPDTGYAAARNDGLRACAGEFVLFLDADDRLLPDAVKSSVSCLQTHQDCAFAYGHIRYFDASGPAPHRGAGPAGCLDDDDPYAWMLRTNSPLRISGSVLYRRRLLEAAGGYADALRLAEDVDLHMRLARAHPICCNDTTVLEVRLHGAHTSRRWRIGLASAIAAQKRQRPYVDEHPKYSDDYRSGLRAARSYWGGHLAEETISLAAAGEAGGAIRNALALARFHPAGLTDVARFVVQRLQQRIASWTSSK